MVVVNGSVNSEKGFHLPSRRPQTLSTEAEIKQALKSEKKSATIKPRDEHCWGLMVGTSCKKWFIPSL